MKNHHAYWQQAEKLIKDALDRGYDVLNFDDGSIITTETMTVVTRYVWKPDCGKLIKAPAGGDKRKARNTVESNPRKKAA